MCIKIKHIEILFADGEGGEEGEGEEEAVKIIVIQTLTWIKLS